MLIFIENTPRAYAWGSTDALPQMLGTAPTGEPQAELWLGTHPGSPAQVAKATPVQHTLIDLVQSDPERYGVNGGPLPFLLKVLAIGAPLSLQVHPNQAQAAAGYAAEEAAGVPRDAAHRNYGDPTHKPELLVALGKVSALSGFRDLATAREDLLLLAAAAREVGRAAGAAGLERAACRLVGRDPRELRRAFLTWVFSDEASITDALECLPAVLGAAEHGDIDFWERALAEGTVDADRLTALRALAAAHPGDPGVLVSVLLHLVHLEPGEAIYLGAGQLHAYLGGIAVEVMASSDNVLRAGLTSKHVDIDELCRIVDTGELADPRFPALRVRAGVLAWRPEVPEFQLVRVRVREEGVDASGDPTALDAAPVVELPVLCPVVLIVTAGKVRIERPEAVLTEVATARRGQSLYISAGEPVRITGNGEVFLASVGAEVTDRLEQQRADV
ncbi:mannose-6-phosphate isomerase, class I [Leucobacter musarum]|uniref:mannose-6-phosphate isomerase, class I n=1 Tax=Leucobacter musarum TaxID=1930747 RepID=UPI0006A7DF12|nr:mannose-6-phosphate isomerase, class I [Leucobacter musarum]